MISTFSEEVRVLNCNAFSTALVDGKFPASGSFIEVSDFERFAFVVTAGATTSALTVKVQQATAANGTPADITNATAAISATDDNKVFVIEVETRKLTLTGNRFVTLDLTGAAGGDDYASILFLGINPGATPVTQPATTVATVVAG